MDLIADMLIEPLRSVAGGESLRPVSVPPWCKRSGAGCLWSGRAPRAWLGDRLTGRLWDYPRWLRPKSHDFDVFHIVDHSYAHLIRVLPAHRTIVTCNDVDAIHAALPGGAGPP